MHTEINQIAFAAWKAGNAVIAADDNECVVEQAVLGGEEPATAVAGEHQRVLEVVGRALADSYETFGAQVLVAKFIPGIVELDA